MKCPKCDNAMKLLRYQGVEVDRCEYCGGLWFDLGESEKLGAAAAAAIDVGDPLVGKVYSQDDRFSCPRCQGGMVRMVDPRQHHIWYEQCGSCFGTFFDAGEFGEHAKKSVLGAIKDLLTPERT